MSDEDAHGWPVHAGHPGYERCAHRHYWYPETAEQNWTNGYPHEIAVITNDGGETWHAAEGGQHAVVRVDPPRDRGVPVSGKSAATWHPGDGPDLPGLDEAVPGAAEAVYTSAHAPHGDRCNQPAWAAANPYVRARYESEARAALVAAYPVIAAAVVRDAKAEGWDEGFEHVRRIRDGKPDAWVNPNDNPHRIARGGAR